MAGFDWPALIRAGVHQLGLKPSEFWALTPAELKLMLGRHAGPAPIDRARLDDLIRRFPDGRQGGEDGRT